MIKAFADRFADGPIVTDGSMIIELARRGYTDRPPDRYNISSPVVIERIYHDMLDAGATLLQSNTLCANRFALESSMLSARVNEINRKGVWLARAAAGSRALVAGVIGPSGRLMQPLGPVASADLHLCFFEQASALISTGCDLVMLKSFIDLDELEIAIGAVREISKTIAIVALKSFPEDGSILSGSYPTEVAGRLLSHGVQAIGSNGTVGPQRMLGIIESLRSPDVSLVAIPDVGIPTIVDGLSVYNAEPAYVAAASRRLVEHGACIIGADGGANVEHIRAIAEAVRGMTIGTAPIKPARAAITSSNNVERPEQTQFHKLITKTFVTTVELDVPRGLNMSTVIEGAKYLAQNGIDAVNISDGARARLRMSPIAISALVQQQVGIPCITHLACRDRNMVALQSELLGAHALGVRNILAVTGDPTHIGDFPSATSVYDVDSIGLIRALGHMNTGRDLMGNPLGEQTGFCISCAVNPVADDLDREIDRLALKVEQGAHVAFSQPVFDDELLNIFLERIKGIDVAFMLGVIPLRTIRHAEFLHYEVPGMTIPGWVRERMAEAGSNTEAASQIGEDIAVEFLRSAKSRIAGAYLMPPFKKYDIAVRILSRINQTETVHATT